MNEKITTTYDRFIDSLSPELKSKFEREHKYFLLEEMLYASIKQDNISVRRLAKLVGVSPTIVHGIRSGTRKKHT